MGMFPMMREEECAESKVDCCTSKGFILKGNMVVKGKVIPCMLSLIKYVAQRKCALFYSTQTPPPPTPGLPAIAMCISQHIQVKIQKEKGGDR